jgi:hypothetical protein
MREETTSRVMAADKLYGEFYDFYSVSPEYFGQSRTHCKCGGLLMYLTTLNNTYMELLVRSEILTSYMYGPTFDNSESHLFLFAAQCFNIESMQKVFLYHSCL